MKRLFLLSPLLIVILMAWVGCQEGSLLPNAHPDTQLFVDRINLTGENRLNTVVQLHWLGTDRDGYVQGYEIAINEGPWSFTQATDSVFRFDLGSNSDSADIFFQVRAIDNLGDEDESPASLLVPIVNTPPVARFDTLKLLPDTVRTVGTILWNVTDLDGDETVDSVFIRFNDGPWRAFIPAVDFLTFMPVDPTQSGAQSARIFTGTNASEQETPLPGLLVDQENVVYLQARDISGSLSRIDTLGSFFLRGQGSDLLVIAEHSNANALSRYRELLDATVSDYDWYNLQNLPPNFWEPTFSLYLRSYDRVFWFSDGIPSDDDGEQLLLSVAGSILQTHLNEGGKLLITTSFPNQYNDPDILNTSRVFDFSPLDSLSSSDGQARMASGFRIAPLPQWADRLDTLRASAVITSADPFYVASDNNRMMEAELVTTGGWVGPSTVAAQTRFDNGETNQVFVSLELYRLDGDPAALETFMRVILNEVFNW